VTKFVQSVKPVLFNYVGLWIVTNLKVSGGSVFELFEKISRYFGLLIGWI
jgi:hypothetical protein